MKSKLIISQILRVISALFVINKLNIKLYYKIILLYFIDDFDTLTIPKFFFPKLNWHPPYSFYILSDKITDHIINLILLIYINKEFQIKEINLVNFLFIYRTIGIILLLLTKNSKFLFYFANFFLEILLALSFIYDFPNLKKFKIVILLFVIFLKLLQEWLLHVNGMQYITNLFKKFKNKFKNKKSEQVDK